MAEARTLEAIKLDSAYKFGCNRYLQGRGILEALPSEVCRKGTKPYLIAGPTAWQATEGRLATSLQEENMPYQLAIYGGHNTYEKAKELAACAKEAACDVIVGVGGGRIMDLAKAIAHFANLPVINVPTSIATCAAFPPLSVMYTEEGASLGSLRYEREVDAILVDMDVIVKAPSRYVASGMLDGLAKMIEIQNGHEEINIENFPIDLYTSYALAQYTTQVYHERGMMACEDVRRKKLTKAVEDITYVSLAVTGMISGCSKGFGQSALAHETYELIRTHFTQEAKDYLHGEIVAVALPLQLYYNGQAEKIPAVREWMKKMQMPIYLKDLGIEPTEEHLEILFNDLYNSPFVVHTEANKQRLKEAIYYLIA